MRRLLIAVLVLIPAMAHAAPLPDGVVRRPGFQYASYTNDGCSIFTHPKTSWRPRRELHVACTVRAGAGPDGVTLKYVFPRRGQPEHFGVVIEDRTHGQYGDIPFITAWRERRRGYVHIPGPIPEHPNGIYVHVEHVYWDLFDGVKEDRL